MEKISFKEMCKKGISVDDLPDDAEIVFEDKEHRCILDPFHFVFEGDPEYEKALTVNEASAILNKQQRNTCTDSER